MTTRAIIIALIIETLLAMADTTLAGFFFVICVAYFASTGRDDGTYSPPSSPAVSTRHLDSDLFDDDLRRHNWGIHDQSPGISFSKGLSLFDEF